MHFLIIVCIVIPLITWSEFLPFASAYNFPLIESSSGFIPTSGGRITLHGVNFGPTSAQISVRISDRPCSSLQRHNASSISCIVPPGVGRGHAVFLTVNGLQNDVLFTMDYESPVVTSIEPDIIDITSPFTITGNNFYREPRFIEISFGIFKCSSVSIIQSHRKVSCSGITLDNSLNEHALSSILSFQ
ncbi:hypothetical protein GEMRC1_003658 [Eukaryota sp. GEM-RC1]